VAAESKQRVGILVLRVWAEDGDDRLRARITDSSDVFSGQQQAVAAAGSDEICAAVRSWLAHFAAPAER
jgi:hypothetical protein